MNEDQLETKTNEELNEIFAVEVAKTHMLNGDPSIKPIWEGQRNYIRNDGKHYGVAQNCSCGDGFWPNYCNTPELVLEHLSFRQWYHEACPVSGELHIHSIVKIIPLPNSSQTNWSDFITVYDPSFCRAAVIALIRAVRTEDSDAIEKSKQRIQEYLNDLKPIVS